MLSRYFLILIIGLVLLGCSEKAETVDLKPKDSQTMSNSVVYFEIPVTNIDRAIDFYQRVFGLNLTRTSIDGNEMAMFPTNDGAGISGALAKGDSYIPGKQGTRIYFKTDNIDECLKKAVQAGGKINYPKTSTGELGWVAEFIDSEGNIIALHSD